MVEIEKISIIISKEELYGWHFLKQQPNLKNRYDYKLRLAKCNAFPLFPRKIEPSGEIGAIIVENKQNKKDWCDLNTAKSSLVELLKITHTSSYFFGNDNLKSYIEENINDYLQEFRNQMKGKRKVEEIYYFPENEYCDISFKFEKAKQRVQSNRILVIFLFKYPVKHMKKSNIDQELADFFNSLVEKVKIKEFSPPKPVCETKITKKFIYDDNQLKSDAPSHWSPTLLESIKKQFLKSKQLFALFKLNQFSIIEKTDNQGSHYEIHSSEENFLEFKTLLKKLLSNINVKELKYNMHMSAPEFDKKAEEQVLKYFEKKAKTKFKSEGFFAKFYAIESSPFKSEQKIANIYWIFSLDHYSLEYTAGNNENPISKETELKNFLNEMVFGTQFLPVEIEEQEIQNIGSIFESKMIYSDIGSFICGSQDDLKGYKEFIKILEEKESRKEFNLTSLEHYLIRTRQKSDFEKFEQNGLKIELISEEKMQCTGKRKLLTDFESIFKLYLKKSNDQLKKKPFKLDSKTRTIWLEKERKIKRMIESHNGYLSLSSKEIKPSLVLKLKNQDVYVHISKGDIVDHFAAYNLIVPISKLISKESVRFSGGVLKAVADKAGPNFVKELKKIDFNDPLKRVYMASPHEIKDFHRLVLAETPQNLGGAQTKLLYLEIENLFTTILNKIWVDTPQDYEKILVAPLLGAGVHSFNPYWSFSSMMNGLINFMKNKVCREKIISIVENDASKLNELCTNLKAEIERIKKKAKTENYKWSWFDKVFQPYDEEQNETLNRAFNASEKTAKIYFAPLRSPGTHRFDLQNMIVYDIARGSSTNLLKSDADKYWAYKSGVNIVKYDAKIIEIIESKERQRIKVFDLFLKFYEVDFGKMVQKNLETGFEREIKREKIENPIKDPSAELENFVNFVEIIDSDSSGISTMGDIYFRKEEDIRSYEQEFEKYLEKFNLKHIGEKRVKKIPLNKLSDKKEWSFIEENMQKSLPTAKIHAIYKIENNWQKFDFEKESKRLKCESTFLWQGTNTSDPENVINDGVGFRLNYAKDQDLYGRGIYFARNANYSNSYCFQRNNFKLIFLAKVLLGKTKKIPLPDPKMKVCPQGFDSVKGYSNGNPIYIIYEHGRSYPEYLVEYE